MTAFFWYQLSKSVRLAQQRVFVGAWLLVFVVLGGCQSTPKEREQNKDALISVSHDQIRVIPQRELSEDPALPKQDLDAEMLADLLTMQLATNTGDWSIAADKALVAAQRSRDYRLARMAALLALRNDNYQQASEGAELWESLNPDSPDALNMLIVSQLGAGLLDAAKQSAIKHQEGKTADEHIKQLTNLMVRQRNKESALGLARHMIEIYPDSAQASVSAAYVADSFEDFQLATQWVERALQLRSGWELAAQLKANLLRKQEKEEERKTYIADYVKAYPDSLIMQINHAANIALAGDTQAAYDYILPVLKRAPRNLDVLRYAGALAEELKLNKDAERFYDRALQVEPTNDDVRWSSARRAILDKNYVKAERLFDDISADNMLFQAKIQVAHARYQTKGLDAAIDTLRFLEPLSQADYISLVLTRHYFLMEERQYDEALSQINDGLYYLPESTDLLYARALVAAELRRLDIAEPDLRFILEQKPDDKEALNALGYTLADQTDRVEEAEALIAKAHAIDPKSAHILDSMGWVAYRKQDYDTAIDYLKQAYDASDEVEIGAHLGEVYWESGQKNTALEIWKKSHHKDHNNPVLLETLKRYGVTFDVD